MLNILKKKEKTNESNISELDRNSLVTDGIIHNVVSTNGKESLYSLKEDGIQLTEEEIQKMSNGDEKTCFDIAQKYFKKENYSKCLNWCHELQHYPPAQTLIGWMYQNGLGLPSKDYHQAMDWYLKATKNGNTDALNHIGQLYEKGLGVPVDYKQAMDWYQKGHANGNIKSPFFMGYLHRFGLGVPASHDNANKWLRMSAVQGDSDAQFALAFFYENDESYRDLQEAVNWYSKAADNGDKDAKEAVEDLMKEGYFPKEHYLPPYH